MLQLGLLYCHFCLNPVDMIITSAPEPFHDNAELCYLCKSSKASLIRQANEKEKVLAEKQDRKARKIDDYLFDKDHDHVTGLFRGSACRSCNTKAQMPKQVPIFFHNLENFDSHELVSAIVRLRAKPLITADDGEITDDDSDAEGVHGHRRGDDEPGENDNFETGEITIDIARLAKMRFNILANSTEKYMQILLGPIVFRDSFKFSSAALASLIKSQRKTAPTLVLSHPRRASSFYLEVSWRCKPRAHIAEGTLCVHIDGGQQLFQHARRVTQECLRQ